MRTFKYKVNSSEEKAIIATTLSVVLALIFDQKKKKPEKRKSFLKRTQKNYKFIDQLISSTIARDVYKKQSELAKMKNKMQYKTKLRNLEIEKAIPFELDLEENGND